MNREVSNNEANILLKCAESNIKTVVNNHIFPRSVRMNNVDFFNPISLYNLRKNKDFIKDIKSFNCSLDDLKLSTCEGNNLLDRFNSLVNREDSRIKEWFQIAIGLANEFKKQKV